ncbi:MAG: 5-methyltetrahydropteroyltriglutamate--homocysteine S-methyltransferase [Thermoleophilaceae bacterium]
MARTAVLGMPRIGRDRELKFALEAHWRGETSAEQLEAVARSVRTHAWGAMRDAGIDSIPSGDFSLYDHMLDTAWGLGAIPDRFGDAHAHGLAGYFELARGSEGAKPLEMTKWFDTNYHYLVPELEPGQGFELDSSHWTAQLQEAAQKGISTRPVVVGPFSFLKMSKGLELPHTALDALVPVYAELLAELSAAGATAVQIDESCLVLDLTAPERDAFHHAFTSLANTTDLEVTLATYFAGLDGVGALDRTLALPAAEFHLDLVRAPSQLDDAVNALRDGDARLSLGLLDGRNVWAADLDRAVELADRAVDALGSDRVTLAPSSSMLHLPHEAARETAIASEVRAWLAFATERLAELGVLRSAVQQGPGQRRDELLDPSRKVASERRTSELTNDPAVRERAGLLKASDYDRDTPAPARRDAQHVRVALPELPTTTIGSYPQTDDIRQARRKHREGELDDAAYREFLEGQVREVVEVQERVGLDVLVHGEPERNDMVEYFGQQLAGFTFSANGWVQSYGSRCVKPPILYGDVSRPEAMTVDWWRYAQSLTDKPMKGMLTGPVTILQWSFVRNDQPRQETCTQIALAVQDEVLDLEAAGCFAIQVDEAALREGLPIQRHAQDDYVRWAVDCFRLTVAPARPDTQVHTHMCYSEFNDMMEHIVRLDADVISIEASRSDMKVLDAFAGELDYPNDIGPGVWDIHSPRVPSADEMERLLHLAEARVGRDRLWVNPDCGLKTRQWPETLAAVESLMEATRRRRAKTASGVTGEDRRR